MKPEKAKQILAEQLPNFELVEEVETVQADADDQAERPALATWSKFGSNARPISPAKLERMERLRERFLGEYQPVDFSGPEPEVDSATSGMILVKPKGTNAPAKAVVIENGKIVSRQG